MQPKKYLSALFALGFAAVGVSASYLPDITYENKPISDLVEEDEPQQEPVINDIKLLDKIILPTDGKDSHGAQGRRYSEVFIASVGGSFELYGDGERIDEYTFTDDFGVPIRAYIEDGELKFADNGGGLVNDFYVNDDHIFYDSNGDLHTSSGILKLHSDDEDLDIQSLLDVIDEDTEAFEALQQYVSTGKLDTVKYTSVNALVNKINEHYYELDRYNAFLEEYPDRDVAEKASAVITELEALTAQINTDTPVYNDEKSGEEPYSLNTNKVTILKNVLVTQLENKGLVTTVQTTTTTRAATKATTTTTKKKTTKKTTKETTTTTTTTTTPMQQTAPPETTTTTAAPVITTTPAPVVTAATTPKPSYTITECNKTIYALQDSVFYDQPDTSSDVRGSCTKYYNANCTGETDNGFYRVVVDGFTLYAVKAAFSDDPQSTVVTTKPVKLDNGSVNKYTKEMLKYINALRKEVGVDPLEGYETLDEAADQRAKELKTLFDHTRPNNKSFTTVYGEFGLKYGSVGENITYGMNKTYEVADAFENWKNSPTHYANMTNPDFRYMAIGYYTFTDKDGNDYNYWEQLFYTP